MLFQNGYLVCGSFKDGDNCVSYIEGEWRHSYKLQRYTYEHVSWKHDRGVLLIGGLIDQRP